MRLLLFLPLIIAANLAAQVDSFFKNPIPAIASTAPDALGHGYFGNCGIGGNAQSTTRLNDKQWGPDGSSIFAFGLGDPEKYIGLDFRVNIYGLSNDVGQKENFGEGTIDWHISRKLARQIWVGIGGYDLIGWQTGDPNKLHSVYACASTFLPLRQDNSRPFSTLFLNAGFGNGRFRSDRDFTLEKTSPGGVFGSVALQVLPRANLIVEWSGYGPYVGTAFIPIKKWPLQIVFGADDLLNHQWRWVLAGSVGFRFKKKKGDRPGHPYFLPVAPPPQSSRA